MPLNAPTADELLATPEVTLAIEEAWADSDVNDPQLRHEEGGWVYLDLTSGEIITKRAVAGGQASIDLNDPPIVDGSVVVGKFHTHPNPSSEGWNPGPSPSDIAIDKRHGVPDLIRADDGVRLSGPNSRRGGLSGDPGYPV